MLQKAKNFFQGELWNFSLSGEKGWRYTAFKWLRIAYLALRGFHRDKCSLRASSLTYYTLMSVVPVLAMFFAIARGFGYQEQLRLDLLTRFQDHSRVLLEIFSFAERLLEETRGGVIAGIGFVVLFWSIAQLLSNMENALNCIWGIKKMRSWKRITTDYFSLMLIAPFLFILSGSMTVFVVGELEALLRASTLDFWAISVLLFFIRLIPYGLFWLLFSFIYLFMPNTRVQFRSAFLGGLFAGCLYVLLQWGYIYFQIGVNRIGAIYGSMAALPLFLIWLQLSWFLLLFGAEISHAHQTLDEHEFFDPVSRVSLGFKRVLSLWIMHLVVNRFFKREQPLNREYLTQLHQLPPALIVPLLQELVDCHLLVEVKGGYIPGRPIEELRISDVLEALESKGVSDFPFIHSLNLAPFADLLDRFRLQIEQSPLNILVRHVPHSL